MTRRAGHLRCCSRCCCCRCRCRCCCSCCGRCGWQIIFPSFTLWWRHRACRKNFFCDLVLQGPSAFCLASFRVHISLSRHLLMPTHHPTCWVATKRSDYEDFRVRSRCLMLCPLPPCNVFRIAQSPKERRIRSGIGQTRDIVNVRGVGRLLPCAGRLGRTPCIAWYSPSMTIWVKSATALLNHLVSPGRAPWIPLCERRIAAAHAHSDIRTTHSVSTRAI